MYKREYKKEGGYLEPEMRRNQKNRGGTKKAYKLMQWERVGGFSSLEPQAGLTMHTEAGDWPRGRGPEPRSELPKGASQ